MKGDWGNMKKLLLFLAILLLTSCSKQTETNTDVEEQITEPVEAENDEPGPIRYTGEIITDGFFRNNGRIYFVPDKETRELLKDEYPYVIEPGESIPLDYDDVNLVKDLPKELGIYKVEVEADFESHGIVSELKSIMLTEEIGIIEYVGKEYPTNELDETVTAKDRVCGLIVSNVRKYDDDDGVMIDFEGEIESEGFYNVYPGGEFFSYKRIGRIVPDGESVKNFPSYKGTGIHNNFSVYFTETNELFQQLADHSAIGRGKFKSIGYDIVYNFGGGVPIKETLTEIISLDESYKGFFPYDDNSLTRPLVNEEIKHKAGFMDKYAIIFNIDDFENETSPINYYFFGYNELSKIKLLTADEFYYGLKENKDGDPNEFELITDSSADNSHSIHFRYFDKNSSSSGKDSLWKTYNYGYFKNGDETVRIFEGDSIKGMVAEDINVEYITTQDAPDELVRIICKFTGETTLTGKLTLYFDEGYEMNMVYFVADEESTIKLPIHVDDYRDQGGIRFANENLYEILGTEPFEKNCEITINNYMIHFAAKDVVNTAELITLNFLE